MCIGLHGQLTLVNLVANLGSSLTPLYFCINFVLASFDVISDLAIGSKYTILKTFNFRNSASKYVN